MKSPFKAAGIGVLALASTACSQQEPQRPNIILILADDLGSECIGCYGGVSYQTPCIDSLARQAIRFENMHAMPLSTPSRVQLMTVIYMDRILFNF